MHQDKMGTVAGDGATLHDQRERERERDRVAREDNVRFGGD
jgi:hypothetical protein